MPWNGVVGWAGRWIALNGNVTHSTLLWCGLARMARACMASIWLAFDGALARLALLGPGWHWQGLPRGAFDDAREGFALARSDLLGYGQACIAHELQNSLNKPVTHSGQRLPMSALILSYS